MIHDPKNPLTLLIDYIPSQSQPWFVANLRSGLKDDQRASTREELLRIIDGHLQALEHFARERATSVPDKPL